MTNTTATAAIERRAELAAEPDRVWRALTDPAELARWWCQAASFERSLGAEGWMEWTEHGRFAIRIETVEAMTRFAWRGARDPDTAVDAGPNTLVEFTLQPRVGGGTILTIRETGFVRDEDRRLNVQGWLDTVGALGQHLASEPWQAGIRRTWSFRSAPERVWRAFGNATELSAWWGGTEPPEIREGYEGWFAWPTEGRFAMRIDRVEPPTYLAWRWTTAPDLPFADAEEVLTTEWAIVPRDDGGTDVHLLETGFRGPDNHRQNRDGWDRDVAPVLRRHLGEDDAVAAPPAAE